MFHPTSLTRRVLATTAVLGLAFGASACGSDSKSSTSSSSKSTATKSASAAATAPLALDDGWVKSVDVPAKESSASPSSSMAMPSGSPSSSASHDMEHMAPMSAMFGTLRNTSKKPITITAGSTPVADKVELHETVKSSSGEMQMQEKKGGFVIPAGGNYKLQPGGDHVMLMELTKGLANGSTVEVTLKTTDGDVKLTVPVRAFSGAEEKYVPSPSS